MTLPENRVTIKLAGLCGARLRAGDIRNGGGVGDAILVHPAKGFFAVGDSSDREPGAARAFMTRFADFLDGFPVLSPDRKIPEDRLVGLEKEIVFGAQAMLREHPFRGTSTFTGLLLLATGRRMRAILFHNGDSILFAIRPLHGIRRITENNFWLLGKVREFYQVIFFDVNPGDRFLFATDGLQDLSPPEGRAFTEYLADLFSRHPVEDIPDVLIDCCDAKKGGKDDLAVLSLAPEGPFPNVREMVLGGQPRKIQQKGR